MYQKEKPQSVLIGTWKFYQQGALLGDFTAIIGVTVIDRLTDRLAELIYKISETLFMERHT
jgi:hypothetical protein